MKPHRHPRQGPAGREDPPRQKVEASLEQKNQLLVKVYNRRAVDPDKVVSDLLAYTDRLQPLMANTGLRPSALGLSGTVLLERTSDAAGRRPRHLSVLRRRTPPPVRRAAQASLRPGSTTWSPSQGLHDASRERPFRLELVQPRQRQLRAAGAGQHHDRAATTMQVVRRTSRVYAGHVNGATDFVLTKLDVLTRCGSRCAWPTTSTDGASTICR